MSATGHRVDGSATESNHSAPAGLDSTGPMTYTQAHRRSAPMRKTSAAPHPVGRRQFLTLSAAGLAAAGLPRAARAQGKRSGELVAGLSERMLTLDPANHYSISATSVHRHVTIRWSTSPTTTSSCPPWPSRGGPSTTPRGGSRCARASPSTTARPFNADSVVFTLRRVKDNTKLIKSFVYQDIEDVQKDGDYAVSVTTKRPFGSLPAHLTMLGMLPPTRRRTRTRSSRSRSAPGRSGSCRGPTATTSCSSANPSYWKPGSPRVEKVTSASSRSSPPAPPPCARARST